MPEGLYSDVLDTLALRRGAHVKVPGFCSIRWTVLTWFRGGEQARSWRFAVAEILTLLPCTPALMDRSAVDLAEKARAVEAKARTETMLHTRVYIRCASPDPSIGPSIQREEGEGGVDTVVQVKL